MPKWEEHRAADTFVSASDATLQLGIFRLTANGAVILTDRCVAFRCKPDGLLPKSSCRTIKIPRVQRLSIVDDTP
jgi:hypothetical protein